MAKKGGFKLNSILSNRYVLYAIVILAVLNVIKFVTNKDWNSLTFFVVLSYLTTCFSKNMTIVLATGIVGTVLFNGSNSIFREGLENKDANPEDGNADAVKITEEDDEENEKDILAAAEGVGDIASGKGSGKINSAETQIEFMQNLSKNIDPEGLKKMTKETMDLMKVQEEMMNKVEKMAPRVTGMLESMGGMKGLEKLIGGMPKM